MDYDCRRCQACLAKTVENLSLKNFRSQRLPASTEHDPTLISALRHVSPWFHCEKRPSKDLGNKSIVVKWSEFGYPMLQFNTIHLLSDELLGVASPLGLTSPSTSQSHGWTRENPWKTTASTIIQNSGGRWCSTNKPTECHFGIFNHPFLGGD